MQILGNRVLVRKLVEEKKEGFQTVDVNDPFISKGIVDMVGNDVSPYDANLLLGKKVLFAPYSPDTHPSSIENCKIIDVSDILEVHTI